MVLPCFVVCLRGNDGPPRRFDWQCAYSSMNEPTEPHPEALAVLIGSLLVFRLMRLPGIGQDFRRGTYQEKLAGRLGVEIPLVFHKVLSQ